MIELDWFTHYKDGPALGLWDTNLHAMKLDGLYVIYRPGTLAAPPAVVRVGQGNIGDKLRSHSQDAEMRAYLSRAGGAGATLNVAVAPIASQVIRNGAERYLTDLYRPPAGGGSPDVQPIEVTLPWAA
jgi:hypothetical protein